MLQRTVSWNAVALILILAAGALLRLPGISSESLWSDEAISVRIAHAPVAELVRSTAEDVHPPLYYLLLKLWMRLFGDREAALRSLSWALGVAALPLAWRLLRRLLPEPPALAALALFALGDMHAYYSLEVRNYAQEALLCLWATDLLLSARGSEKPATRTILLYALAMGGALYTHYFSGFLFLAHAAWFLWDRRAAVQPLLSPRVAALFAFPLLLFLPWSAVVVHQMRLGDLGWMAGQRAPVAPPLLYWTIGRLTLFGEAATIPTWAQVFYPLVILPLLALGAAAAFRRGPARTAARLALCCGPGILLCVFVISYWKRIYLSRFFTMSVPFWLLLLVLGLWSLRWARLRVAWLALLVAGTAIYSLEVRLEPRRPQWRQAAALVQRQGPPDALVVLHAGFNRDLWNYYAPHWKGGVFPTTHLPAEGSWVVVGARIAERAHGRPVWLILSGFGIVDPHLELYPELARRSRDGRDYRFGGDLAVVRLGPLAGP